MNVGEVPVIKVSDRIWNDAGISASLGIIVPTEVGPLRSQLYNSSSKCSSTDAKINKNLKFHHHRKGMMVKHSAYGQCLLPS